MRFFTGLRVLGSAVFHIILVFQDLFRARVSLNIHSFIHSFLVFQKLMLKHLPTQFNFPQKNDREI